jgi:uncharacterized protein (UPF0276 family)
MEIPMSVCPSPKLPSVAGIGLRTPHIQEVLNRRPRIGWLEVHAENYMTRCSGADTLERLRHDYPLSVHGVGLSLGSANGLDSDHLRRLKDVCDRFQPAMVSEHLAWSVADGVYLNDLLPVPYDDEALDVVCANILRAQDFLKRPILIENLSAYVGFAQSSMEEPEFLSALVARTGCGLLLDINNVYVSAQNLGFDTYEYISALPAEAIDEMHLAGHAVNQTDDGPVLIDNHGSRVAQPVWALYAWTVARIGRRPTLIEWDSEIPALDKLLSEAKRADVVATDTLKSRAIPPAVVFKVPSKSREQLHA